MTSKALPIRKKRNFKALTLESTPDSSATKTPDVRSTKPTAGKKRPPPMTLKAPKIGTSSTSNDYDGNMLTVPHGPSSSAPPTASASKTYHSALSEKLANFGEDLKNEDLKDIQELGQGNGGSVKKVEHTPTGMIMAKKVSIACSRLPISVPPPPPYDRISSVSIHGYYLRMVLPLSASMGKFTNSAHRSY